MADNKRPNQDLEEFTRGALQRNIQYYYDQIAAYAEKERNLGPLLAILPDLDKYFNSDNDAISVEVEIPVWTQHRVNITLPWVPELVDEILMDLQNAGWKIESEKKKMYEKDYAPEFRVLLIHPDLENSEAYVVMDAGATGSICKLVKIGTRMIEHPIYDVKCGEET